MKDFSFSVPQNIIAGRGSIAKLPEVLKQFGTTRAFIISGPHLAKIGTVQSCIDRLAAVGISAAAGGFLVKYLPDGKCEIMPCGHCEMFRLRGT